MSGDDSTTGIKDLNRAAIICLTWTAAMCCIGGFIGQYLAKPSKELECRDPKMKTSIDLGTMKATSTLNCQDGPTIKVVQPLKVEVAEPQGSERNGRA